MQIRIKYSVVIVLADYELHHKWDELSFLLSQNRFRSFIVIVLFLFHQVVNLIKVISNFPLKIHTKGLNLAANWVLISHTWNFLKIKVFRSHSLFFFPSSLILYLAAFDASFHISQQNSISLLLESFLLLKNTFFVSLFFFVFIATRLLFARGSWCVGVSALLKWGSSEQNLGFFGLRNVCLFLKTQTWVVFADSLYLFFLTQVLLFLEHRKYLFLGQFLVLILRFRVSG